MAKHIFITGGVVSSLGKGITAASLGRLLKSRGLKVALQKFDPYINVDPGTMSPYQHGEVYVTDDGAETDLDVGHYERFVDVNLTKHANVTTGKVYQTVLEKERKGLYKGQTVQVIPHITNEIKNRVISVEKQDNPDVIISEIGGTVGDIESLPFLEAIRQLKFDVGKENVLYIHVTLIPYIKTAGELKTKPTQHSVKELRSIGIQPDILVCRTEHDLSDDLKRKLALFCDVALEGVIQLKDAESIYEVPLMLAEQNLDKQIIKQLNIECAKPDIKEWEEIVSKVRSINKKVTIGLVGKYVELPDAYLSLVESLNHAGISFGAEPDVKWINAEEIEEMGAASFLNEVDAIVVPGGFGERGIEGKIATAKYARENGIPYLGISLGMQCAIIDFARNVCSLQGANSSEFENQPVHPVVITPNEHEYMRLGSYPCDLIKGTKAQALYGVNNISERHRHRYEVNNNYVDRLKEDGMVISGLSPDGQLVEIIELPNHPWFVACQFHPEYKSRPNRPHPLITGFIAAALEYKDKRN